MTRLASLLRRGAETRGALATDTPTRRRPPPPNRVEGTTACPPCLLEEPCREEVAHARTTPPALRAEGEPAVRLVAMAERSLNTLVTAARSRVSEDVMGVREGTVRGPPPIRGERPVDPPVSR